MTRARAHVPPGDSDIGKIHAISVSTAKTAWMPPLASPTLRAPGRSGAVSPVMRVRPYGVVRWLEPANRRLPSAVVTTRAFPFGLSSRARDPSIVT